jgi:small conductance mechanosensitive channel
MEWLTTLRDMLPVELLIRRGAKVLVTIIAAAAIYLILRRAIKAAARTAGARMEVEVHRQRVLTLLALVSSLAKYVIIFFAGIMVLRDLGVDPTPLLAGAGIVGLAVGFGAQNLVRDVVSGFFIIMEGQYAVGDLVEINDVLGRVEEVGLRVTKIRDSLGLLRYFPNGGIRTANNYTEEYVAYVITVPVPPEEPAEPVPLVRSLLEDFEREFRAFVRPAVLELDRLPSYARVVRAKAHAIPGKHTTVEQKLPARLAAGLERAGHPMPAGTEVSISLRVPPPGAKT